MKRSSLSLAMLAVFGLFGCAGAKQSVKSEPVAAPLPAVEKKTKSADQLFTEGVADFDAGRLDEAAELFKKCLELQPQMVNAQYNLGVLAEREGRLADAEVAYHAARKIDPTHRPTLLNLGKVFRLQDKFDQAIALYEQALKTSGREHDVALLNNLTVAYRLARKFDLAEATARKVLSRTKDNPDAFKNLALIYYDQGNYRLAEFISANARKLDEKDPGVYNNLGMIYLKLDERRLALGQFQKSVALNDHFAPGHMNIGAMALSYRDYDAAEKAFAKAVQLDPTSYEAYLGYGYALDGQKGRDPKKGLAAAAQFERVLSIKADHPEAICGAGWAYAVEKTGWEKAITFLEKCKGLNTTSAQEQQLIDAKLKGLAAMMKSGQAQPAVPAVKKEAPKKTGGPSMLDKASEEEAKQEGATPSTEVTPASAPGDSAKPEAPAAESPKK